MNQTVVVAENDYVGVSREDLIGKIRSLEGQMLRQEGTFLQEKMEQAQVRSILNRIHSPNFSF